MYKTATSKTDELFTLTGYHFLVLFLTLFSLLIVYVGTELSSEIYIAYQRKFVVPEMEKKFGFRAGRQKIDEKDERSEFVIESVEPGGLFDQAGFKPGDLPVFHECRFFWVNRSNESRFFELLSYLPEDGIGVFRVINIDDFRKTRNHFENQRKFFLITNYEPCAPPR